MVSALVTDANAVVAALTGAGSDQVELDETAAAAVALLAWWPGRTWNRPRAPRAGRAVADERRVAPDRVIST